MPLNLNLKPIVELGVAEAYDLLAGRFGQNDLPPLEAIENEDWGRDHLLSRLQDMTDEELAAAGLRKRDDDQLVREPDRS